MFVERRVHGNVVELWECDWERPEGEPARKVTIRRIGVEQPLAPPSGQHTVEAICWAYGRTLGNIAVFSQNVLGSFRATEGSDAILSCDFVDAGKFRHGKPRWWCRTHQTHWGTNADLQAAKAGGVMVCSNHSQPMHYVVNPPQIALQTAGEIGIWCSLPAALSSTGHVPKRAPKIHVHVRPQPGGPKTVDQDFNAISLTYNQTLGLFANTDIDKVNVTPPAAMEFMLAINEGRALDCVNCSHCGYPHLDLGEFAKKPHKKHFCGNCGRDSTWSKGAIVSTPLKPMHDQFAAAAHYIEPARELDLDDYHGCQYVVWASTPAVLWTAARPQEVGIHVHISDGKTRVVDDTFGKVKLNGKYLDRNELLDSMVSRTVV